MRIVTLSPIFTPLSLKPGIDPRSPFYGEVLRALPQESDSVHVPNRKRVNGSEYQNLEDDGYDLRLAVWAPPAQKEQIRFHIFPGAISIAEVTLDFSGALDAEKIEAAAQARTKELIKQSASALSAFLRQTSGKIPDKYLDKNIPAEKSVGDDISWIARTLVLSEDERSDPAFRRLLRDWLEHTASPEDAAQLSDGEIDYSMTWLNYVIVERDPAQTRMLLSAMRIAQYFYAAQDSLNDQTQMTLARAYFMKNVREAERLLLDARDKTQMLRIEYDIQKSYLNRNKRRVVDDIMAIWDYQTLVENGGRMIDASSAKINEINTRRSERNSLVTDLILVGIGLLAVMEVSLYLTEYSREVMSRPALEYQDSQLSWVLSTVAAIDTDFMLLGGAVLVIFLVLFYVFWKTRK